MKKMSKGMLMTALICGAVYLGGSPVYASELQEFSLDEYVVTAARTETKLVDTPVNISVVDAETIEERHYQNTAEVLKDVPGVNVLDGGVGVSATNIVLNGDDRVLILVDGRRLSLDMGAANGHGSYDFNQLPDVGLIERIEVLKGAAGSLYGSDAVGGVVNIITKQAERSFGKVAVGFGSHDTRDMSAMYSFKEGKTGVTLSASKFKQGYHKYKDALTGTTKRWPEASSYDNEKISLNVMQEINEKSSLTFGYDYSKLDGLSYSSMNDYSGLDKIEKQTDNIYTKYDWGIKGNNYGYIQYYHNELDYFEETRLKEKTDGIDIQQVLTIDNNNKLVVGASWRESEVDTEGNYKGTIENTAFFMNDTWEFAPSWSLNAGIRYDEHSEAGDETTLSAGLNKKFDDNSHAYVNWGQVFRAPTANDLFYTAGGMLGNPNLNPETGETWTIGYSAQVNERTNIGVNYFESNLEDAITWEDHYDSSSGDWTHSEAANVAKQEKKGMELSLGHKLNDNIKIEASYTYVNVKNDKGNGFIRDWNYIPNTYRFAITYNDGKWNSNIALRAANGAATHGYDNGYGGTTYSYVDKNYLTLDLVLTYKATEDLSVYFKGYNLTNDSYAERAGTTNGSYNYPAQSRRFIVGAEYKF